MININALSALTAPEEYKEVSAILPKVRVSLQASVVEASAKGRKIIFAFFQSDFKGGKIAYWHVTDPAHQSYGSTLSMEGLKSWKVIC